MKILAVKIGCYNIINHTKYWMQRVVDESISFITLKTFRLKGFGLVDY